MRITYINRAKHVKLHGTSLTQIIDSIPHEDEQAYAREIVHPNMSGDTFVRLMRDKFGWTDIDTKECACSCAMAV